MAMSALQWKRFYEHEREALGAAAIEQLIVAAPDLVGRFSSGLAGTVIFPHTRLRATGSMTATVARAVIESKVERVLALGVLHGGREEDVELVSRARAGDQSAVKALRGIHGPGAPEDRRIWTEEFSLDNFKQFVIRAAEIFGQSPPEIIERYPFFTGTDPQSLPGFEELRELTESGVPIVATADPVHHGIGYGTPPGEALDEEDPNTITIALSWIEEGMSALSEQDYDRFLQNADRVKSDFRHSGPVLRELLKGESVQALVEQLHLVDYSDVLQTVRPTWVAGAIVTSVST